MVFRVPQDHDGVGIVCPGCRRLLKIPHEHDEPPPLMVPLRSVEPAWPQAQPLANPPSSSGQGESAHDPQRQTQAGAPAQSPATPAVMMLKRKRRRKSKKDESPDWERDGTGPELEDEEVESRRMHWMLGGGGLLLAGIIAGVILALRSAPEAPEVAIEAPTHPQASQSSVELSDMQLLQLAEPLAGQFLNAGTVEALLPLVRDPSRAEPRMRRLYPDGTLPAPGLSEFKPEELMERQGKVCTVQIRNRDFEPRLISFVETPGGLKVDWEAWVGWSDISWADFTRQRITKPTLFRVVLEPVEYYNFGFSDENQWVSYRLTTLDGESSLYGYAVRGSDLDGKIKPPTEFKCVYATLMLRFPDGASDANQVLIDDWLGNCWSIENEPSQ